MHLCFEDCSQVRSVKGRCPITAQLPLSLSRSAGVPSFSQQNLLFSSDTIHQRSRSRSCVEAGRCQTLSHSVSLFVFLVSSGAFPTVSWLRSVGRQDEELREAARWDPPGSHDHRAEVNEGRPESLCWLWCPLSLYMVSSSRAQHHALHHDETQTDIKPTQTETLGGMWPDEKLLLCHVNNFESNVH